MTRQLTDAVKEERARCREAEKEIGELRQRLAALERLSSEEAKSDWSEPESLYNPQSYNLEREEEEESKEPRGAIQAALADLGRFSCQQCDMRFDSKAQKKKHSKSKEHLAKRNL